MKYEIICKYNKEYDETEEIEVFEVDTVEKYIEDLLSCMTDEQWGPDERESMSDVLQELNDHLDKGLMCALLADEGEIVYFDKDRMIRE